jgi:type II secretory pathway component PulJ
MRMSVASQRGLGLVELMVGITVGLIVAAGASMVAVNQINEHRRLMLETQIQQDLRMAADLLQQDLRRAGFRGLTEQGVWAPPSAVGTSAEQASKPASDNPYIDIAKEETADALSFTYMYARYSGGVYGANVPRDAENFGFKWDKSSKTLSVRIGKTGGKDNWQPITDPDTVRITDFDIDVTSQQTAVGDFCDKACGTPATPACPVHTVRQVQFTIVGEARHDPAVKRTLSGVERLRADSVSGACPV